MGRKKKKKKRKIIQIDEGLCTGCGECVPSCAEGAIEIIDGKARLVADFYCDGLGACLGHCPEGALSIIEREADEFDEEAVEELLKKREDQPPRGCPSTVVQSLKSPGAAAANLPASAGASALSHWPVQIKLVPPNAPFLKGADLLVAADCTPFAFADFHREFIEGRTVLVGCPKLDNANEYAEKFAEIFKSNEIKSVTVPVMQVPCCQMFPRIIGHALKAAGKDIKAEAVVISTKGEIIKREKIG